MAHTLEHFELRAWQEALPRRRHPARGRFTRTDRSRHGRLLIRQAKALADSLRERVEKAPAQINPKLIFKLQLHRRAELDEETLARLGLRVLGKSADKVVVVFPDDRTVSELRRRLAQYARLEPGHQYAYLDAIEAIAELTPEDRIGRTLQARPLGPDETATLDIEMWQTGDHEECAGFINQIVSLLQASNLRVTDRWIGKSLCLARARLTRKTLESLLTIDFVKEVDRKPEPSFEMAQIMRLGLRDFTVAPASDNLVGVLVVDSGVMQRHPLIGPALGDAQVFPDRLRQLVKGGPEDGDQRTGGHGTAVAGIAVYGDVSEGIASRHFVPSARLFSARVTDDMNTYDEDELLEHQLDQAIVYFMDNYPSVNVVNISLGHQELIYDDSRHQFRFAAAIDELAYRYRERNVLFVISAGNFTPSHLEGEDEEILQQYPRYLLDEPKARIVDPATAALALTVGGLSYGLGRPHRNQDDLRQAVAGHKGWPSPFTRLGWGVNGAIKPDLVDFAGDLRFERGKIQDASPPAYAGLPTTARDFAPPDGRLFRAVSGTSFAAPRVANLAARLFREFPEASSNLVRALIANSATLPEDRPPPFVDLHPWDDDALRVYGNGQADFDSARWSAENDVVLVADGSIELDQFQLYIVPPLPEEFLYARGKGHIAVTLAYDPPTRHTRAKDYLGVVMHTILFRNVSPARVAECIRSWSKEEKESLGNDELPKKSDLRSSNEVQLKPRRTLRRKGTLQRGIATIPGAQWRYEGQELVLAVICQRNSWVPPDITDQRYAVVVSLRHENPDLNLYAHVQQHARVYQRVRVRV